MSARVLITGAGGFAGTHLRRGCEAAGDSVVAPARAQLDLTDARATRAAVAAARPDRVFHLAALASVGRSWEDPGRPLRENVETTLNVLEAVRLEAPGARVLLAGTGEVYGRPASLPVDEDAPLRPQNPYAVSKCAADLLGGLYADAHGLAVLRARAFNHAGPGQGTAYVVGSLARQVAVGLLAGEDPISLVTGNPDARRDFADVRDVVRAYRLLADGAAPDAYNVCSERSVAVSEIVARLGRSAGVAIDHQVDRGRLRAHEVPEVRGCAARLRAATAWEPEIALDQTLADAVAWWREHLGAQDAGSA